MRVAGIIAEYDPFHNGHQCHVDSVRQDGATHVVAVISGSFTQRGEPALLTKFQRAEMALRCGVDLVLELPLPFAMAPAERFATGGIATLQALGCVDTLSFGSECGDVEALQALAVLTDTPDYTAALKNALASGIPYAAARQKAVAECKANKLATLLDDPNNTLALEYIRAARRLGAPFGFHTLKRVGAAHNAPEATAHIASASLLRDLIRNDNAEEAVTYMPTESAAILRNAIGAELAPSDGARLESAILARLRSMSVQNFASLPYLSEGLENRLYEASRAARSYDALLDALKTRRYPMARLRRIVWAALLGMPSERAYPTPPYIRVLGMNTRGREIFAAATPTLPVVSRAVQFRSLSQAAQELFALECRATDLHALTLPNPPACASDLSQKLITL
ncbi:MAG: nucleotidyltransferase family protein [Clostridia bacterium]|nr:nucleotidyltransferase family protein [Clostridia bacterium]